MSRPAVGILGGAFNPPHIGHLVLAHEAAFQLGLERVILIATGRAPHKRIADDPGGEVRHEMAAIAASTSASLAADPREVEAAARSEEPTYTVETLRSLLADGIGAPILLLGADMAATLESWHEPEAILELARLGVAGRPGAALDEAEAALARLGGSERAEIVAMPEIGVSSTRIRRRVAEGGPIAHLVPTGVAELIAARGLYAPGGARNAAGAGAEVGR